GPRLLHFRLREGREPLRSLRPRPPRARRARQDRSLALSAAGAGCYHPALVTHRKPESGRSPAHARARTPDATRVAALASPPAPASRWLAPAFVAAVALIAYHNSLAAARLCAAHPLNPLAVTYVVQRSESLASLLYLVTLYAVIRGAASARHARPWYAVAAAACAIGAAAKPLVVSAPLVVLLYDRFFLAESFGAALRRRWALY